MPIIYLLLLKIFITFFDCSWAQEVTPTPAFTPALTSEFFLTKFRDLENTTPQVQIQCANAKKPDEDINCHPQQNPILSATQLPAQIAQESIFKAAAEQIKQWSLQGLNNDTLTIHGEDDDEVRLKIVKSDGIDHCYQKITELKSQETDQGFSHIKTFFQSNPPKKISALMDQYIASGYLPPEAHCFHEKSLNPFSPDECFAKILPHLAQLREKNARQQAEDRCLQFFSPDLWYEKQLLAKMQVAPNCQLTKEEIAALLFYTGNGYSVLNGALRSHKSSEWDNVILLLNAALKKLAPYAGHVRRGASLPEKIAGNYQQGSEITETAYTSTSVASGFGGKHQFVIKTKGENCFYLGKLSMADHEEEVLCLPGTRFEILSRVQLQGDEAQEVCDEEHRNECIAIIMAEK